MSASEYVRWGARRSRLDPRPELPAMSQPPHPGCVAWASGGFYRCPHEGGAERWRSAQGRLAELKGEREHLITVERPEAARQMRAEGMTLAQMAETTGWDKSRLSKLINGRAFY